MATKATQTRKKSIWDFRENGGKERHSDSEPMKNPRVCVAGVPCREALVYVPEHLLFLLNDLSIGQEAYLQSSLLTTIARDLDTERGIFTGQSFTVNTVRDLVREMQKEGY